MHIDPAKHKYAINQTVTSTIVAAKITMSCVPENLLNSLCSTLNQPFYGREKKAPMWFKSCHLSNVDELHDSLEFELGLQETFDLLAENQNKNGSEIH
jgi:hypothetical protein